MARNTERRERFLRMRDIRMPKAVKAISLLRAFSRRSDYEMAPSEARGIIAELEQAVAVLRGDYGIAAVEPEPQVTLSDERNIARVPVGPGDRSDIRAAVRRIEDGDVRRGVKALRKVILGWKVPDDVA